MTYEVIVAPLAEQDLRRNADWLREHFRNPAGLRAGSRMPSYAHLFGEHTTRGEDLIAYLLSRGTDQAGDYWKQRAAWTPSPSAASPTFNPEEGMANFRVHCAACHGPAGQGDGPFAEAFHHPPALNLQKNNFLHVPASLSPDQQFIEIARIIKYGIPGTAMAGHEALSDRAILALTEAVLRLRPPSSVP